MKKGEATVCRQRGEGSDGYVLLVRFGTGKKTDLLSFAGKTPAHPCGSCGKGKKRGVLNFIIKGSSASRISLEKEKGWTFWD